MGCVWWFHYLTVYVAVMITMSWNINLKSVCLYAACLLLM